MFPTFKEKVAHRLAVFASKNRAVPDGPFLRLETMAKTIGSQRYF
jgi:hypothetical protein